MANKIQFKRSSEKGIRPVVGDLDLGEIAANVNEEQPGLFIKTSDENNSKTPFEIIKIGPTAVLNTEPVNASKGETWLTDPADTDTNQRFPTLKVHDGSKFVDAIRMVIPEIKAIDTGNVEFKLTPDMSGKHIHIQKNSTFQHIVLPRRLEEQFVPGEAVTIYNGRYTNTHPLDIQLQNEPDGRSIIHYAGTSPQEGIGVMSYRLNPGALVTLLCVDAKGLNEDKTGTFVLSGAGVV